MESFPSGNSLRVIVSTALASDHQQGRANIQHTRPMAHRCEGRCRSTGSPSVRNHVEALNAAHNEINAPIGQKITASSNSRNCLGSRLETHRKEKHDVVQTSSRSMCRSTLLLPLPGAVAVHLC